MNQGILMFFVIIQKYYNPLAGIYQSIDIPIYKYSFECRATAHFKSIL